MVVFGLAIVFVAFGAWLTVEAQKAKSGLEQARGSAQQARDALSKGDTAQASDQAGAAVSHAREAQDAAHSVPWDIAAAVPWLGRPFKAGQEITDVVRALAVDVLEPAAAVGTAVSPDQLVAAGRIDVQLLRKQEPTLTDIAEKEAARERAKMRVEGREYQVRDGDVITVRFTP